MRTRRALGVCGLATANNTIESGLLFAINAKARAGGLYLLLHIICFAAKGHI